jgi:two-component system CheB/CheR fusion protein
MPASAIASGMVDFILEPELMPTAIEDYISYGGELLTDSKEDEKFLTPIINLIKEKSPLDFSDYKQNTILRRTKRRAAHNNFISLEKYLEFLKTSPEEVDALSKDFLISVTSFFRDKEAFDFIKHNVLPDIIEKLNPDEELKIWVAGCATGEEVYSIAILVAEQLTGQHKDTVVKIFATDIDSAALVFAGKASYNKNIAKDVSPERLEKYFTQEGNNYKINPAIRKMVIFAQHDLVKNPPYCNMHFISCRNLLIYMTSALQKKIFSMLLFGLKMDGYLFLGSSENPMPIIKNLEVVNKKWKIYKNLETKRELRFDAFLLPELIDVKRPTSPSSREDISKNAGNTLTEAVNTALVAELDTLVVCVDEHNMVIKTYGDTTKYLLQKNFNPNLTELLPKPLAVAFNNLSTDAIKNNKTASVKGVVTKHGQKEISVGLTVSPLVMKKGGQKILMVIFREDNHAARNAANNVFDEKTYLSQYTINIEEELKELKEKLHSTYEQLDASNENMQSFNEELLSANEEMQSTNEEMQSVNEELDTINSSYQLKNKELSEINDDLNNYFRSNVNGQLFVDKDLRLMKFSPGTVKQINLLETDIGRPLSNISTNIKFETIIDDVKSVFADGVVISKEIETNNGKWYQIMTMPYIQQADNKSNGAIITFNDITELKNAQFLLNKKNNSLLRINEDLDNFAHTASHDLLAPLGNIETSIAIMNKINTADPYLEKFLGIVNTSIKKFRVLIKEISTVARIESEMGTMELVDMDEIINNIVWSLDDKIKADNVVIIRNFDVKFIYFSKKNMRSILFNLVSNAIKFKRDVNPVVMINIVKNGDMITLSVQDNGIGIAPENIDHVFEIYRRLHDDIDGQGVGLYLAKKLVNAANGQILVESQLDKASKFIINFEAQDQQVTTA